jgi:hypothetical protein
MAVMKKITLIFTPQEFDAIVNLAIAQHREPRQQAAFLVRQQLERLMLLQSTPKTETTHDRQPIR